MIETKDQYCNAKRLLFILEEHASACRVTGTKDFGKIREYIATDIREYEDRNGLTTELGLLVTIRETLLDVLAREGCDAPSELTYLVARINDLFHVQGYARRTAT
jgi:hypothetical protein